jgi:hypothetical protein
VAAATNPEWTAAGMKFVVRPVLSAPPGDTIIDMEVGGPSGRDLLVGTYSGGLYLLRNGVFSQVTTFAPPAGQGVGDIAWGHNSWYVSTYVQPVAAVNDSQNNPGLSSQPDSIRKGSLMVSGNLVSFTTTMVRTSTRTNPLVVLPNAGAVTLGMNNSVFAQFSINGLTPVASGGGSCMPAADGMVNAGSLQAYVCNTANGTLRTYNPANSGAGTVNYGIGNLGDISALTSGSLLLTGAAGLTKLIDPQNLASATTFNYPADFGTAFEAADDGAGTLMLATANGLAVHTANTGTWYLLRAPALAKGHRLAYVPGAGFFWSFDNRVAKVQLATGAADIATALGAGPQYATLLTTLASQRDGYCNGAPALNKGDFDCQWQYLGLDDPATYTVVDGYCPANKPNDVDCKVAQANALYGQASAIAGGDLSSLRPSFGNGPGTTLQSKTLYYGGNAAASSIEGAMRTDSMTDKAVYLDGALDPLWDGYQGIADAAINQDNNPGLYQDAVNAGNAGQILTRGASAAVQTGVSATQNAVNCATTGSC